VIRVHCLADVFDDGVPGRFLAIGIAQPFEHLAVESVDVLIRADASAMAEMWTGAADVIRRSNDFNHALRIGIQPVDDAGQISYELG